MRATTFFALLVLGSNVLMIEAAAQVLPDTAANRARGVVGCTQTTSGIDCSSKYKSGGGGGSSAYYQHQQFMNQMMMNTMQGLMNNFWAGYQRGMELRRQRQAALRLNDAGIAYGEKGNWRAAADHFQRALQYSDDATIRKNLAWAEDELSGRAEARRQAERQRRAHIAGMFDKLSERLNKSPGSFDGAGQPTGTAANELEFLTPKGTAFFGEGGEAPPPVDPRDNQPDEHGLAFMHPDGATGGYRTERAPPAAQQGATVPTQVAAVGNGLQFISPDTILEAPSADHQDAPPPSPKAALLLDALAQAGGDWNKSKSYLLDLRHRYPNDPNVQAAIVEHDRVRLLGERPELNLSPDRDPVMAAMEQQARGMIEDGQFLKARVHLMKAFWQDPTQREIGDLLNGVHLLLVKEGEDYKERARQAVRAGRYDEAARHLGAARTRIPADHETIERQLEAIRYFQIDDAIRQGEAFSKMKQFPEVSALLSQAEQLYQTDNFSGAVAKLEQAARLVPRHRGTRDRYYYSRGLQDAQRRPDGHGLIMFGESSPYSSMLDLQEIDQLGPETSRLFSRAQDAMAKGDLDSAIANLREAQMHEPGNQGLMDDIQYVQGLIDYQHRAELFQP